MSFRGFDEIATSSYEQRIFRCKGCENTCDVTIVETEGRKMFYGDRCEKYQGKSEEEASNPFDVREKMLEKYLQKSRQKTSAGLPRAGMFYELAPLWAVFLSNLGFSVVPSQKTNKRIISDGLEKTTAEFCYPFKVAFGHFADLDGRVDFVFAPDIIQSQRSKYSDDSGIRETEWDRSRTCPYLQNFGPVVARNTLKTRCINPVINLRGDRKKLFMELRDSFSRAGLNFSEREIENAFVDGEIAYLRFKKSLRAEGKKVLDNLGSRGIVIVGRPYTAYDEEMNLKLAGKVAHYGFTPLPMDFLPLPDEDLSRRWGNEFSIQGQLILGAANVSRKLGLNAVFLDYFGCGPNSFLRSFFERELGKPFLTLQIDEHTADAGLVTRLEAFLDSIELQGERR
ncbi:hypothetical protein FJZ19_02720 [Candidatus Pacearchaeota archaeon]|nr:hypothetical protein [Candidatus Pacearchaeota archaeon]